MKQFLIILAAWWLVTPPVFAAPASKKITQLSLEELLAAEVTSVSRSPESLSRSPAAVYVITQEQIRRSGATKIPDLLRMVPGLQVAQINAGQWAISARGFNGTALANKLLVLVDGRSVYTLLYAGVYWDRQDLVLEDIDRIEVIRGPGGSVWGANAVNGVINIITKKANLTQDKLIKGWGGTEEQGGAARFGGKAGENYYYRAFAKYFRVDDSYKGHDDWQIGRGGYRSDWQIDPNDNLTVQGDYYKGKKDELATEMLDAAPFTQRITGDAHLTGGDVLMRWDHVYSETSESSFQMYYDITYREDLTFTETRHSGDLDWQHRFRAGERNEIVWGLSYRLIADETEGTFGAYFDPASRIDNLIQAFLQDKYALIHDRLWLTVGSKFEINSFTGFEIQPTARLMWQPHERHSLWTAVSRAVRTPARLDHDLMVNVWLAPGTTLATVEGNSGHDSESLIAYEAGYRVQPHDRVTVDAAVFFNDYSNLTTIAFYDNTFRNGIPVQRYQIGDDADANTVGAEISTKWQLADWLRFETGYTFLQMFVKEEEGRLGTADSAEGQSPEHQVFFQPSMDLPFDTELDAQIRYVDDLKTIRIPAYWEMNLIFSWRPRDKLEFSVVGQNLLHGHHQEFTPSGSSGFQRAVYGKVTVRFD